MDIGTIKDMHVIGGETTNPGTLGDTDYTYQANAPLYASDLNYLAAGTTNITIPFAKFIYDAGGINGFETGVNDVYDTFVYVFQEATYLEDFSISISSSGYLSYDIILKVFGKDYEFSVNDIAIKAYSATRLATARTITLSGDASGSVSFSGTANVTLNTTVSNSAYADGAGYLVYESSKQHVNAGDDLTPVHIEDGEAVACGNVHAVTAETLSDSQQNSLSVGSSTRPVYFSNGVPVAANSYSRLYLHSTSLTLSSSDYPQYRILWLSSQSSAISLFSRMDFKAIVGGLYIVSGTEYYNTYVALEVHLSSSASLLTNGTYHFQWIMMLGGSPSVVYETEATIGETIIQAVYDEVLSI